MSKVIWDFLIDKTHNPFGTAAIMGNLMAESSLNPLCATGKDKTVSYVSDVYNQMTDFANDGVAFGIAQWCYKTRKAGLLEYARTHNKSIGDLQIQLEYLWKELSENYRTAYNAVMNATDIRSASDIFMLKYEKPAGTGDKAKQKRADYGQMFYDKYADSKKLVTATANVNIRTGNGKQYQKIDSLKKGNSLPWIATAENGWYAVQLKDRVGWVSGEFSTV